MGIEISCFTCRWNATGERVCEKCTNLSRYEMELYGKHLPQRKEGS